MDNIGRKLQGGSMKSLDLKTLHSATPIAQTVTANLDSVNEYVLRWARNPKPNSYFAQFTKLLRLLPDSLFIWALRRLHYGGQLLLDETGNVIGHIFYQQHGDEIHMFSIEVNKDHEGRGYANRLMRSFLLEMGNREHINWLRISAGGSEAVIHLWKKTLAGTYHLPYRVEAGYRDGLGWVNIKR